MKNLLCFLSAIFLLAAGAHAVTTGQYEVRVYNGNSFTPSYLTLSDGQALGQNGGVPAAVSMTSGLTVGSTSVSGTGSGDLLKSDGTSLQKLTPGTGVSAALANAVNGSGGLLTYGIIGTSGAAVPLLNAANTFSAPTSISGVTNTQAVTMTGTVTGSGSTRALMSLTDTWTSTGSVSPRLIDLNINDSGASNINYGLTAMIQCSRNGTVVWKLDHGGSISAPNVGMYFDTNGLKIQVPSGGYFTINGDVILYRDAAGIAALRNGTSAQVLRVNNTYTSSTNWEAGVFDWQTTTNTLLIGSQVGGGGGTARDVQLVRGGATKITVGANTTTHAQPVKLPNYTVSGLPSASTCGAGSMAFVTDATSTTGYTSVAGGGSNKVLVVSDGTNWIIH